MSATLNVCSDTVLQLFDLIYGRMLNSDSVLNRLNSNSLVLLFVSSISVKLADCSLGMHLKGYVWVCIWLNTSPYFWNQKLISFHHQESKIAADKNQYMQLDAQEWQNL